jgi:hypothetical protein
MGKNNANKAANPAPKQSNNQAAAGGESINTVSKSPGDVFLEMMSTAVAVKGKPVFYFLTELEQQTFPGADYKNNAQVVKSDLGRHPVSGQIVDKLVVFISTGNIIFVDAAQDSSRQPGSYDLYREGDLRN